MTYEVQKNGAYGSCPKTKVEYPRNRKSNPNKAGFEASLETFRPDSL